MRAPKIIMISALAGLTSCQKAAFHEMPAKNIAPVVTERIDSFARESQKILKNPEYKKFKNDTLQLTEEFFRNPSKFFKRLNKSSKANIPDTCTKTTTILRPVYIGKTMHMQPIIEKHYEPLYKDSKAVINSNKIFTTDSVNMFVPVEYWGIRNKNLKR